MCSSFLGLYKCIDNKVCSSQLLDLLLHCFFEDTLLRLNQAPLLFIVLHAILIAPSAMPPATPRMLARGAAVGRYIATFFAESSAFGAGSEAAAAVANHNDKRATTE
jgi:hypothetical protein